MSHTSYRTIQTEVLRRIRTRVWQPGQIIPSEVNLAVEFNCARATINRALRELAETGIIDRRRKAGTRVSLNPVRKATLDIPMTRIEIEARGLTYGYKMLAKNNIPAPEDVTVRMNLVPLQPLLHVKCLHLADGKPHVFEDRWINPNAVPNVFTAPFETVSPNEWLLQNVPISGGDIVLTAEPATVGDAAALGIPKGTALFVAERRTFIGTDTITFVRLAYAPGYRMTTHI
ncbi:MAG: UTRA domain-containing protein [Rhodobacterales bacterium]